MWSTERRVVLDVLMACWGMSTWLGVNGIFVQLPLLVERAPEGWALPSSMTVAVAAANAGLLVYALLKRLLPRVTDTVYIYGLLVIALLALFLNSFVYSVTVEISGEERSIPFLTLVFFTGLVGCTSSVVFYPYMRHFKEIYLATYLAGEGLSGFLPSILSLIQGVGGDPECVPSEDNTSLVPVFPPALFSTQVFLLILATLAAISLVAFTTVDKSSSFGSERVDTTLVQKKDEEENEIKNEIKPKRESLLQSNWIGIMLLMAGMNAMMNGVLPSVQSYSCMPYGTQTYHLAVSLSTMANPLACLAGVWLKPIPAKLLGILLVFTTVVFAYILATALLSPEPPLMNTVGGEFLVVASWVWVMFLLSYARMWVYGWARAGGAQGMRAVGAAGQVGSSSFAVALYFIVNYTDTFTQAERCPPISM